MRTDRALLQVPLGGYTMQLRKVELDSVAAGLGEFGTSEEGNLVTLADALRRMPQNERAPMWELAVRRYGRHKPLEQAAGEIGMDEIHARYLIEAFTRALGDAPPPEKN